jgi:hypothetical protein
MTSVQEQEKMKGNLNKLTALARWNLDACQSNHTDSGQYEHQGLDFLVVKSSLWSTACFGRLAKIR